MQKKYDRNGDASAKTLFNIPYGSDPDQIMDIYLPANRSIVSTKILVMIHGGGWTTGDKSDFNDYIDTLKKDLPDYAVFNINYRLNSPGINLFPAQENDVRTAFEFISSKTAEYLIAQKFVWLGASAGAHLALLQAHKYSSIVKVKAVVDFFGPTDLIQAYSGSPSSFLPLLLLQVTGKTPIQDPDIYQQSSPVTFVTAQSPPTLILHGGIDILVSPNQSILLKNKLQAMGVINQLIIYPTENHGWTGPNLSDSFAQIKEFLKANVN
jgi:acetyl esterase/lipase